MENPIEYVIYVRKSTDESSGQQTQSIPDQIKKCVDYAKMNDLVIRAKPKDFEFETEVDLLKEDKDEPMNVGIFQQTRGFYIIKEQQSAKNPRLRPKWKKLISLIRQGKIKGLLSYSPDRQARNAMEGGELIDCVDNGLVDLKYTNFHFENTASGKMMLGIRFVFSKQYSDKLSEDITRGKNSSVAKGKSQGKYKYGYYRDPADGYDKPHPKYFPLMKEAFQMKLYMGASDEYIAQRLNTNGFMRENKKGNKPVNAKMLYSVRVEEFYYGMYVYGNSVVDLREVNPYFKPLITEDEHCILLERFKKKAKQTLLSTKEDKYAAVRPIPKGMFKSSDGYAMCPYIASVQRLEKKLAVIHIKDPEIQLKDIIQPHQIRYRLMTKQSKYCGTEFTFDAIDKAIFNLFNSFHISDEEYNKMVERMKDKLDEITQSSKEHYNKMLIQLNRAKAKKKDFIKVNLGIQRIADEQDVYSSELHKLDDEIDFIQKELLGITESERNSLVEAEIFLDALRKLPSAYKKFNYVRKRSLIEFFVSNIYFDKQKRLVVSANPDLQHLFSSLSGDDGIRTHV